MGLEAELPRDGMPPEIGPSPEDSMPPENSTLAENAAGSASGARSSGTADGSDSPVELDVLVTEHHVALYRYAYRLTGSVHDAEDITQQTFLVAREKLSQVRDARHVRGWLCTVLRNCYLKGFRQNLPTPAANFELNLNEVAEETDESPIDSEQLQIALGQLPADFRLVLLMFYFEELSYREIADALTIPLGTVMSRLARAKSSLRRLLQPLESEPADSPERQKTTEQPVQPMPTVAHLGETRSETETSLLPFPRGPMPTRR